MKPIELELSGLHSYKKAVRVDFDHLGEHGVFGIFGAIGSGKSSLLDGLTLALYGIVDRVSTRSRQGVVNHHSREIEVRLRFSVQSGGEPEVFEVHRIYRRTKTGGAHAVNSRISRIEGEQAEVLADKETEVTQAIEQLLGLNATDFMRAVVLPQGRFMRFLHLKGVERRQMLQRIFRLSAFGEGLRKQIKKRRQGLELALEGRRGQLSGLGDASAQAIAEAEAAVERADQVLNDATESFEAIEQTWQQARVVRERQQRLARAEAQLAEHLEGQRAIDERIGALQRADRAGELKGPWERRQLALERYERALTEERAATSARDAAVHALEAAEAARAKAEADRVAGAPGLRKRQVELTQAVGQAQELAELRQECQALDRARVAAVELSTKANAELERLEEDSARTQAERKQLTERLAECQVPREQREKLQEVVRAHDRLLARTERRKATEDRLESIRGQRQTVAQDLDQATGNHERAVRARQALEEKLADLPAPLSAPDPAPLAAAVEGWQRAAADAAVAEERIRVCRDQVQAARQRARQATDQLATAQVQCRRMEAQLEAAEAALIALQRQHAASVLAEELDDDEPCPVCGSTEHPAPAERVQLDDTPVQVLRAASDRARTWREAAGEQVARLQARLEAAVSDEQTAIAHAAVAESARSDAESTARAVLPEALSRLDGADRTADAFEAWQANAREQARSQQVQREALKEELAAARVAEERASAPVAGARAQLGAVDATEADVRAELEQLRDSEGEAWAAFDRVKGPITLFDVKRLAREQARRDQETQELLPRIQALELRAVSLEADLDAARSAAAGSSGDLSGIDDQLRIKQSRCERLELELGSVCPDAVPSEALQAASERLDALEAAVTAATRERDGARTRRDAASERAATATAELQAATEQQAAANEQLDRVLRRLDLPDDTDLDAILEGALPDAERATERAAIEGWKTERATRQAAVDSARQELGDERVDARAFETLDAKRQSATIMLDVARSAAHRAAHHLDDLIARAERYQTLSAELADLEKQLARLQQLSHLVRGDRFVDFLANDYLRELVREANRYLSRLTDGRYSLVIGGDAAFEIQDADGGGSVRPVHTLSGGETFMASLALALALSTQVQARSSQPLEFFFLDEGFGSLDAEALDRVMGAIESLRDDARTIGLISHVPAVRERVPRYIEVSPPGRDGTTGSTIAVKDN